MRRMQLNERLFELLVVVAVAYRLLWVQCGTWIQRFLSLSWRLDFYRLKDGFVGSTSLQFAEGLVEDACQGEGAVWLLQVTLVPVVENATDVAVFQR